MFVRRKTLTGRTTFNKNFVIALRDKLTEANLDAITVKIPHNYVKDKEDSEISIDEFLNRERNYPSIILRATNDNNEEIKILFVNISAKAFFYDHTFPSGHSEPSELYISTGDPVRTWGLFEYFYNYIKGSGSKSDMIIVVAFFISLTMLIAEFSSYINTKKLLLNSKFGYSSAFDIGSIILCFIVLLTYFNSDKGVYVKERDKKASQMLLMLIKGEFRDNPILNFALSIIASILASIILAYSGCNNQ